VCRPRPCGITHDRGTGRSATSPVRQPSRTGPLAQQGMASRKQETWHIDFDLRGPGPPRLCRRRQFAFLPRKPFAVRVGQINFALARRYHTHGGAGARNVLASAGRWRFCFAIGPPRTRCSKCGSSYLHRPAHSRGRGKARSLGAQGRRIPDGPTRPRSTSLAVMQKFANGCAPAPRSLRSKKALGFWEPRGCQPRL